MMTMVATAQIVQRSVVASGAIRSSCGSIRAEGTIGQPIVGMGMSRGHFVGHGFWQTASQSISGIERSLPFPARITPQPASTVASIEAGCSGDLTATVLTVQGQQVAALAFVMEGAVQRAQLACGDLASGLYLVRLRCGSQQLFLPLMIAK